MNTELIYIKLAYYFDNKDRNLVIIINWVQALRKKINLRPWRLEKNFMKFG